MTCVSDSTTMVFWLHVLICIMDSINSASIVFFLISAAFYSANVVIISKTAKDIGITFVNYQKMH